MVLLRESIPVIQPCKKVSVGYDIFCYSQAERTMQEYYAGTMTLWHEYELETLGPIKNNCYIKGIKKLHDERKVMQSLMKLILL